MAFINKINADVPEGRLLIRDGEFIFSNGENHQKCVYTISIPLIIDDGVNVFSVSKFLGRKSVSTTMKYIGITPKMTE